MALPLATYRIQFNAGFTFQDMRHWLPYLRQLGIDTIYAAPILAPRPDSVHGYDTVDASRLNPQLGSYQDWLQLQQDMNRLGLKWLQDIVPNHMAQSPQNPWLADVLRHGPNSPYAPYFDIDWQHPDFQGKMVLPVLGQELEAAIQEGHIQLADTPEGLRLIIYQERWPVAPSTESLLPAGEERADQLAAANEPEQLRMVVDHQHYRPEFWRRTDQTINYRRFFTVNELMGLRQELPQVFHDYHTWLHQQRSMGNIQGFRVDHVDGLLDPTTYLKQLRTLSGPQTYIVVEKILEVGEQLPEEWPIQGTTGYDFMAAVNQLLTADDTSVAFSELYTELVGGEEALLDYHQQVFYNKHYMLHHHFRGELDNLVRAWMRFLKDTDWSPEAFRELLGVWLAAFPVYRTYPVVGPLSERDRKFMEQASEKAAVYRPDLATSLRQWKDWLLGREHWSGEALELLQRTQQLSGPLMAKGVEDTTFYRFWRQANLNEVGTNADPLHEFPVQAFHRFVADRPPTSMNATATHDTKRGETARALLQALSGYPDQWRMFAKESVAWLRQWEQRATSSIELRTSHLYALLQTVVASFPLDRDPTEVDFEERLENYLKKALREGKSASHWASPNTDYEERLGNSAYAFLQDDHCLERVYQLRRQLLPAFYRCSLTQIALKCLIPGVPDIYQGTERWDQSMVDPDNRRPVDYNLRQRTLTALQRSFENGSMDALHHALNRLDQPDLKMMLLYRCLHLRRQYPGLFLHGTYEPIEVEAPYREDVLAFRRRWEDRQLVVIIPIHPTRPHEWPVGSVWNKTGFQLEVSGVFRHLLTGQKLSAKKSPTRLADWLSAFPLGIWVTE